MRSNTKFVEATEIKQRHGTTNWHCPESRPSIHHLIINFQNLRRDQSLTSFSLSRVPMCFFHQFEAMLDCHYACKILSIQTEVDSE